MTKVDSQMEAGEGSSKISGGDDHSNFRPSRMRNYWRSKNEEANPIECAGYQSPSTVKCDNIDELSNESLVQPPLPQSPPPPDSPPFIKQEKEDLESPCGSPKPVHHDFQEASSSSDQPEKKNEEIKGEMCRNFIRGTCDRGSSCIFVHKVIQSQLKDVYRFCIDFQNPSGCTRPSCKFVHATVFEKERFYETAYLPPHTLAHFRVNNKAPPLPAQEVATEVLPVYVAQPAASTQQTGLAIPQKCIENSPATPESSRFHDEICLKRDWNEIEDFTSLPRDIVLGEPSAKKCKHCDLNKIRFQYTKNRLEKYVETCGELDKKINMINIKSYRLHTLFKKLLAAKSNGCGNARMKLINDKDLLPSEQFGALKESNSRLSLLTEDNGKNNSLSSNFVAMVLQTLRQMQEKI